MKKLLIGLVAAWSWLAAVPADAQDIWVPYKGTNREMTYENGNPRVALEFDHGDDEARASWAAEIKNYTGTGYYVEVRLHWTWIDAWPTPRGQRKHTASRVGSGIGNRVHQRHKELGFGALSGRCSRRPLDDCVGWHHAVQLDRGRPAHRV
jgi:hypothetical protein